MSSLAMYQIRSDVLAVLILGGIALFFLAAATLNVDSALAWNHRNEKTGNTASSNVASTVPGITAQKVSNKDLKNLFDCISTTNKDSGSLTQDDLQNCYSQALPTISTQTTAGVTNNSSNSNFTTDGASPIEVSDGDTSNSAQNSISPSSSSDNEHNHD